MGKLSSLSSTSVLFCTNDKNPRFKGKLRQLLQRSSRRIEIPPVQSARWRDSSLAKRGHVSCILVLSLECFCFGGFCVMHRPPCANLRDPRSVYSVSCEEFLFEGF